MLRKRDSQYRQLKICLPPICLYCRNIILLQGLLIDSRNDLFLEYSCGCKQKKSIILFDKYYYQLQLFINFLRKECNCQKNKSICYCNNCDKYLCEKCIKEHTTHFLFDFRIEDYYHQCKTNNMNEEIFCFTCRKLLCSKCNTLYHNNHSKKSLSELYNEVKEKINTVISSKSIIKKMNIQNSRSLLRNYFYYI